MPNDVSVTNVTLGQVDCTNEAYHGGPGISKSHLDVIERSPMHYWQAYINPERTPRVPTVAMRLGTAIHSAVLEPELFAQEYAVEPEEAPSRPTSRQLTAKKPSEATADAIDYWEAFDMANEHRTILTRDQWDTALGCREAVRKHSAARALLQRGSAEVSFYGVEPDTGALVKCRTDWLNWQDDVIVDVKSTVDASPDKFMRSVLDYRYHVQVPFYRAVMEAAMDAPAPKRWVFLAIEKTAPYAIGLYTLPEDVIKAAWRVAQRNLQAILDGKLLGHWPDFGTEVRELVLPRWAERQLDMDSPEQEFA